MSKPGTKAIKMINIEPDSTSEDLQESYSTLLEAVIPLPFRLKVTCMDVSGIDD